MPPLVVLQNSADVGLERFADGVAAIEHRLVRLDRGEPVPAVPDVGALLVLGGHQGAYQEDIHPYLVEEKALLRDLVAADVPVLGICLGCQLLADALGGAAYLAPEVEARFEPYVLTDDGIGDPVARHLVEPTLSLHEDTWDLPPGATLLASSPRYPQAFRMGSAIGIQTHPEVTVETAAEWVDDLGRNRIAAAGVDPQALLARVAAANDASELLAQRILAAWMMDAGVVQPSDDTANDAPDDPYTPAQAIR